MEPVKVKYRSLTDDFLSKVDLDVIDRDAFRDWGRTQNQFFSKQKWKPMKEGENVPADMIEYLIYYLNHVLKLGSYKLTEVSAEGEPPTRRSASMPPPRENVWEKGWPWVINEMTKEFVISEDALCKDEDDLRAAAEMAMHYHGVMDGKRKTKAEALDYSTKSMNRDLAEYTAYFRRCWEVNEYSVLFTVAPGRDGPRRIGMTCIVPITEQFYMRFLEGRAEEIEAGRDDLPKHSLWLHVNQACEDPEIMKARGKSARAYLQVRTMLSQTASICPLLKKDEMKPRSVTLAGDAVATKRLRTLGYVSSGRKTPITGRDIWEHRCPINGSNFVEISKYGLVRSAIQWVQGAERTSEQLDA
ncbi:hypothetical protein ACYOEI_06820 [Singulisphaera rosea]